MSLSRIFNIPSSIHYQHSVKLYLIYRLISWWLEMVASISSKTRVPQNCALLGRQNNDPGSVYWPSLGSRISTVAAAGNSITPITGSDSKIWKVSACSYFPSVSIRTRHVALVCPGLNWTCLWDLPLKSSSIFALPSSVPMPERYGQLQRMKSGPRDWYKHIYESKIERKNKGSEHVKVTSRREKKKKGRLDIHTL